MIEKTTSYLAWDPSATQCQKLLQKKPWVVVSIVLVPLYSSTIFGRQIWSQIRLALWRWYWSWHWCWCCGQPLCPALIIHSWCPVQSGKSPKRSYENWTKIIRDMILKPSPIDAGLCFINSATVLFVEPSLHGDICIPCCSELSGTNAFSATQFQ